MSFRAAHSVRGRIHESRRLIAGTSSFQAPGPSQPVQPAADAEVRELRPSLGANESILFVARRHVKIPRYPAKGRYLAERKADGYALVRNCRSNAEVSATGPT